MAGGGSGMAAVTRLLCPGRRRAPRKGLRVKLLVHVGLHRAASTSLQNWLLERKSAFEERGLFVHAGLAGGQSASPFAILVSSGTAAMGPAPVADYLHAAVQELPQHRGGLVSDENLLGHMPRPGVQLFGRLESLCATLDALERDHEIVPVIVVREHVAWLKSLHRTYQTRGGTLDLADFAKAAGLHHLRFAPVLAALAGDGRRHVIADSIEQIEHDGGAMLLSRLAHALELPLEEGARLPRDNPSFGAVHRRITAALGGHHAMLAGHGSARLRELLAAPDMSHAEELAQLVHQAAVRVAWNQTPARRMNRAQAAQRLGIPPERRVAIELCRDIVREALAPAAETGDLSTLLLDAFAADRQTVAETWLPEWRTPPT